MKNLLSLLFLVLFLPAFSQTENESKAMALVKESYNNSDHNRLFEGFNAEMKAALPAEQIKSVFDGLKVQLGKITTAEYSSTKEGTAIYKTSFESGTLFTLIHIDNNGMIDGLFFKPYIDPAVANARNTTPMKLPFKEEWFVFWGGDTPAQNYHVQSPAQKNAFDLIILDSRGQSYKTDRSANDDFYAFGKKIYAPCDGEVADAIDGVNENKVGEMNALQALGNSVTIKTANNEYVVLAHFKKGSVKVKKGDKIKQGTLLGQCGNTGNSSEPHLHFHIQNAPWSEISAVGVKCFFDTVRVTSKGVTETKKDYSPVKGERIKP